MKKTDHTYKDLTIGILALQGSVIEHERMLCRLGVTVRRVLSPEDLQGLHGLILPGGESTTLSKLMRFFGIFEPLRRMIEDGLPVFGTCAGCILLATEIIGEPPHLAVMDMCVRRNAYGRQIDSFETTAVIPEFSSDPLPLVFIRAPWIESVGGEARALLSLEGRIVAARERNMLVTSFHPELTDNTAVHSYFAHMCAQRRDACI